MARTSVNQSPSAGDHYPFAAETPLTPGVLDLYVTYPGNRPLPLSLTVSGSGPWQFVVKDANDAIVIDKTSDTANTTTWGTDRTVYQWIENTVILRVVVRTDDLVDDVANLDPRTCNNMPTRVTSLTVDDVRMTGSVRFSAGYNIAMVGSQTERNDGGRLTDEISMDAISGAGEGRAPGCEDTEPLVRRINGIQPGPAGNFIIQADDCLRTQLPLNVVDDSATRAAVISPAAAVQLASECQPCCDCDYFVRTYRGLKRMWNRWKTIATTAEQVRDIYSDNRTRWLAQLECRSNNTLRIVGAADSDCAVFIGGSYCNFSKCCLIPIELRFTLVYYRNALPTSWPGATVRTATINGSPTRGDELYSPTNNSGVFRFFLDYANPQATTMARFKIKVDCAAGDAVLVYLTAHAADPEPDRNGTPCVLPVATVPTSVSDQWAAAGILDAVPARAILSKAIPVNPSPATFC